MLYVFKCKWAHSDQICTPVSAAASIASEPGAILFAPVIDARCNSKVALHVYCTYKQNCTEFRPCAMYAQGRGVELATILVCAATMHIWMHTVLHLNTVHFACVHMIYSAQNVSPCEFTWNVLSSSQIPLSLSLRGKKLWHMKSFCFLQPTSKHCVLLILFKL